MLDFIIVGQGIAGTMLSWFLMQEGKKVLVVDARNPSSASRVASGITNPITGRKFVKTWMADELIPFAEKTYRHFEGLFEASFYSPIPIIKLFDSVKAQNDWSVRCNTEEYKKYLQNAEVVNLDKQKVKNDFGGFEISGGSRLMVGKFLDCYRDYLKQQGVLLEERFDMSGLTANEGSVAYKQYFARNIIFCEGFDATKNDYFKLLPFVPAKGECLVLKIEDFYPDKVINGEVFLMPMSNAGEYYLGATHEWNFNDAEPSQLGREELLGNLKTVLSAPFEIKEHWSAIRPTVKDRRPFVGMHPEFKNVGIFNGMGTKGISLAPFFAQHFAQHLSRNTALMSEVDIRRFA